MHCSRQGCLLLPVLTTPEASSLPACDLLFHNPAGSVISGSGTAAHRQWHSGSLCTHPLQLGCLGHAPSIVPSPHARQGLWFSRLLSLFGDQEARILVLGLDNAGKTTILCEPAPGQGQQAVESGMANLRRRGLPGQPIE